MSSICSSFLSFHVSSLSQLQVSCLHLSLVHPNSIATSVQSPLQFRAMRSSSLQTVPSCFLEPLEGCWQCALRSSTLQSQPGMSDSPGLPWACRSWELWTHRVAPGGVEHWAVQPALAAPALHCLQANEPPSMAQDMSVALQGLDWAWYSCETGNHFKGIDVSALLACVISTLHREAQFSQHAG